MATTMIVSRDPVLRRRVQTLGRSARVVWVEDCEALEQALSLAPERVLVDLNVKWPRDVAECIAQCRAHGASSIVAFLHEHAGELAIRARLAGADRVIPQNQLEDELAALLGSD